MYKYQNPRPDLFGILIKKTYQSTIFGTAAHGCKCHSLITIYENLIVKCNKPIEIFFYSWIDNASPHTLEEGFIPSNIRILYLPSNITTHLQLCDAGIIWSFKVNI